MRKLKKFVVGNSVTLSAEQMMDLSGGDKDPNVCHSKSTDDTCSGKCYQYEGGPEGNCYWNFQIHNCYCSVAQ